VISNTVGSAVCTSRLLQGTRPCDKTHINTFHWLLVAALRRLLTVRLNGGSTFESRSQRNTMLAGGR